MTPDQILTLALALILLTSTLSALAWDVRQDRKIERHRIEDEHRRRLAKRIRTVALMGDGPQRERASNVYGEGH